MAKRLDHKPDHFQQQAIDSTARGIRIVAPAGSGKSETLARRVAKRIEKDNLDPRRILVLTFDNAAKKSLAGFFGELLDRKQMPEIRSLNQHGREILRSRFPNENMSVIDGNDTNPAWQVVGRFNKLGRSLPILNWDGVQRSLVKTFVAMKEQGFYPGRDGEFEQLNRFLREEYFQVPKEGESAAFDDLWGIPSRTQSDDNNAGQIRSIIEHSIEFEREMRGFDAMQLVDQKSRAAECLFSSPEELASLREEFDEIIVDESQDISRLDAMLIHYSVGPNTVVVLAGDDDQTLYEWRNAHSLYLRRPEIIFGDLEFETIHLDLNYRSPQEILDPAIRLISHNVERIEKSPKSAVIERGILEVYPTDSSFALEHILIQGIKQEIEAGHSPEDIAVLCHQRNKYDQQNLVEAALRRAKIPVVDADSQERVNRPGVWVRTFQRAKGRQWPVVFIPDVNDRDLPDTDSIRKDEVESVRRRFYVAMTRASEKLVLSYVRGGDVDRIDQTAEGSVIGTNGASRFLFEAGVVQPADEEIVDPVNEETGDQSVASIDDTKIQEPIPAPKPGKHTARPEEPVAEVSQPKKRVRPKKWEPYAPETRKLAKAQTEWQSQDYDNAIFCAWAPLESVLHRMVTFPPGTKNTDLVSLIDEAFVQGIIDEQWKDRLHLWRRVRNQALHNNPAKYQFKPDKFRDYGFQLVDGATEFFTHLAERHAPKQMVLETQDEFLRKLGNLVTQIQQGRPSPLHGKPLKAIRFHPEQDLFDVLTMQFLMVLRDVRFYIPEEFRWNTSPLIGKYAVDTIGHLPTGLRPIGGSRLRLEPGEQLNQLLARFDRALHQEAGETDPATFLTERFNDGLALENGNFHAGLKLNPRVRS